MRKVKNFIQKKNTFRGNLSWILVYIFLSLNIFSLSPFFIQWTKKIEKGFKGGIPLGRFKDLDYGELLVIDLVKEIDLKRNTQNLVNKELNQLRLVKSNYNDIRYLIGKSGLSIVIHKVEKGENLWNIARRYGIDIGTIISFNNLKKKVIVIGQKLKIPSKKGILHRVRSGEALWSISREYNLPLKVILEANNIKNASRLRVGEAIFLPGADYRSYKSYLRRSNYFILMPVSGNIVSRFGTRRHPIFGRMMFHSGIDIKASYGAKVKAAMSGKVIYSGWSLSYGKLIVIRHRNGYTTKYAHNSRNLVRVGEYVRKGQVIALVGKTGVATGCHLHFEILKNGIPQNPLKYLPH
jgi:murein DD-endopeptidase MepM/ murein hydrolase activator NlpD